MLILRVVARGVEAHTEAPAIPSLHISQGQPAVLTDVGGRAPGVRGAEPRGISMLRHLLSTEGNTRKSQCNAFGDSRNSGEMPPEEEHPRLLGGPESGLVALRSQGSSPVQV